MVFSLLYKGAFVPFLVCRLCSRVMREGAAGSHECCTVTADLANIHKNERSRIAILEGETVNPLYLHISPVRYVLS